MSDTATINAEIADVVVDCHDPERLARFWSALLGREIGGRRGPYVWLDGGPLGMAFQRTDAPRSGKNRVHIDLRVDDVHVALSQVEALGGHRVPGYEDGGFLVAADPEGNEFCLLPRTPFRLDDEGRADYLS